MFTQYKDVLTHLPEYSHNVFRKDYLSWVIKQMKSWSKFSYYLMGFNLLVQIYLAYEGWGRVSVAQTVLGFIGANLSVATVVGISNRAPVQGWFGATSAIAIAASGLLAGNFADATLQIGYLVFLDAFCILSPKWNNNVHIDKMHSGTEWIKYIVFFFIAWGASYVFYGWLHDPRILLDSATLAISVTGSLLEFNCKREQYWIWTISSVITLLLWIQTARMGDANYALVASYSIFFLNDMWAFFSKDGWFRGTNNDTETGK